MNHTVRVLPLFVCLTGLAVVVFLCAPNLSDVQNAFSMPASHSGGDETGARPGAYRTFGQLKADNRQLLQLANRPMRIQGPRSPNIALITVDDLTLPIIESAGAETPTLNQLLSRGAVFDTFYAGGNRDQGQLSLHTGSVSRGAPQLELGQCFWQAGYRTALIGDYAVVSELDQPEKLSFFETTLGFATEEDREKIYPDFVVQNGKRTPVSSNADGKNTQTANELFVAAAQNLVDKQKHGRPFFMQLSLSLLGFSNNENLAPDTPQAEEVRLTTARKQLDAALATLQDCFERVGVDRHTMIVLVGTGQSDSDVQDLSAASNLRETDLRSVLIFYWPGHFKPGPRTQIVAGMNDLLPTFAELIDANSGPGGTGISLGPALYRLGGQTDRVLVWIDPQNPSVMAIRSGQWKAIFGSTTELFDISTDPLEKTDLSSDHPAIVAQLASTVALTTRSKE